VVELALQQFPASALDGEHPTRSALRGRES
jgi:hypothetical protein